MIKKNVHNILLILIYIFFLIAPLYIGLYKDSNIVIWEVILITITIFNFLYIFLTKKKIICSKLDFLIFLFSLIYFPNALINNTNLNYAFYHFFICIFSISVTKLLNTENEKNDLLYILMISSFLCCLISYFSIFIPKVINFFGINTNYGDFYPTSDYRLYGTLMYPNTLALLSVIGILITIYKFNNNNVSKIILYINTLVLMLTISKSIIILFITFFIAAIIFNYKNNKENLNNYIDMFFPLILNIKIYINCYFSMNVILLILYTILLFVLYLVIHYFHTKILKNSNIVSIILIIAYVIIFLFPIKKEFTLKKAFDSNTIIINNLYNLNKNNSYKLNIAYQTNKDLTLNIKAIKENWMFIVNDTISSTIIPKNSNQATIYFDIINDYEYAYIELSYEFLTSLNIYNIDLQKGAKIENLNINYYILPTSYINILNSSKYDKSSINSRIDIYKDAFEIIKQNPILGHGFNYFNDSIFYHKYNFTAIEEHNYLLKLLVETGIIGIICFILILIYSIFLLLQNKKINTLHSYLFLIIIFSSMFDFILSYQLILIVFIINIYYIFWNDSNNIDIMFISSSGGHLTEILKFKNLFKKFNYVIITEKNKISLQLKNKYKVNYLFYCSRYYIIKYIFIAPINIIISFFYFVYYNPKIIITTGAHTAIPCCILSKIFKKKLIFIEVFDRFETPTLSGKIVYKLNLANTFIVQHKKLQNYYKNSIYIGDNI